MKNQMLALVVGHNYRAGGPVKADDLIARVDMFRRLLGDEIPCKQIGVSTFAFDPSYKEDVFAAVNWIGESYGLWMLDVNFFALEMLDEEFELWRDQRYLGTPGLMRGEERLSDESSLSAVADAV